MLNGYKVKILIEDGVFPNNRFEALNQFLELLGFREYEWNSLFMVINRANCGFLEYEIGDISAQLTLGRGETLGEDEDDWVRLIFSIRKEQVEKSADYTFEMNELKNLSKKSKIELFKGNKQ